ncbi:MAG: preprotein translocase subunit SecG [Coriobacteriales bacterium]|nr:preprotein translocase subunit SecG [Coriobacteriales bacterium]
MSPLVIFLTIVWFLSGIGLVVFILMHSGKGTGVSDMIAGSMYSNMGGTGTVEKNLDRITIACAVVFVLCLFIFMLIFPLGHVAA